jgi:hypothetical protein
VIPRMKVAIERGDEVSSYTSSVWTQILWERHFKKPISALSEMGAEGVTRLAYIIAKNDDSNLSSTYEEWIKSATSWDVETITTDPTPPVASSEL